MTRINTHIGWLAAEQNQARGLNQLQQSLNRLSTGLQINMGKDEPAGLVTRRSSSSDQLAMSDAGRKAAANAAQAAGASDSVQNVESARQSAEAVRSRILEVHARALGSYSADSVHRLLSG